MEYNEDKVIKIHDDTLLLEDDGGRLKIEEWPVLLVDDELLVHKATEFALEKHTILGKKLKLFHADSAESAKKLFLEGNRFSVALIDVVMETNEAGLELIEWIRNQGYESERLIIRTGQPGYAPELSVLRKYDINDYRTKEELTSTKLVSVLITAIRSYHQLMLIKKSRQGLKNIVDATHDLFSHNNLQKLSYGILIQITDILDLDIDGFVCVTDNVALDENDRTFKYLSGIGSYKEKIGETFTQFNDPSIMEILLKSIDSEVFTNNDGIISMVFPGTKDQIFFVYIETGIQFSDTMCDLLMIFAGNIDLAFRNIDLLHELRLKAYFDKDTGIPNQNSMYRMLGEVIKDPSSDCSLIQFHSDNWETLYGSLGYEETNKLQKGIYDLVTHEEKGVKHVAKMNNGNLSILVDNNVFEFDKMGKYHLFAFEQDNTEIQLTVIAGVVKIEKDISDPEIVIRRSIITTYWAKQNTDNSIVHYDESMTENIENRIYLLARLKKALLGIENPIEIYFQPKVNTLTQKIAGAEALSRWKGFATPDVFIPLIEESGMSGLLNDLLIENVAKYARQRSEQGLPPCRVSINLSMKDIEKGGFGETIVESLHQHDLSSDEIELEITENQMMGNVDVVLQELLTIKRAGYSISIDDFGTGYSSLSYLAKLPLDIIKIDKAFVDSLSPVNARKSIISTIAAIAENRNLMLVAEGIENSSQIMALLFFGCDICQGFYYYEPMCFDDFVALTHDKMKVENY